MQASGVVRRLTESRERLRREEQQLKSAIDEILGKIADHETGKLEAYKALARLRLNEIAADAISRDLTVAEQQAKAKYETFTRRCAQNQDERRALEEKIVQAENRRADLVGEIEASQGEIAALEDGVRQRLMEDESWKKPEEESRALEAQFAAARKKALARETERVDKSRPYLADGLFEYLLKRHYGTAEYRGSGLTRWGDGFVARTIQYEAARRNFTLLNELPKRLEEHADELGRASRTRKMALAKRYRDETVAAGIAPLEQKLGEQIEAREEAEKTCRSLQNELAQNRAHYRNLTEGDAGDGLNAALAVIVAALRKTDLAILEEKALKTATREDDGLVRDLGELDSRIAEARGHLKELRDKLQSIENREAELRKADEEVRGERYDGGFTGDDSIIAALIEGILDGISKSGDLQDHLRKRHQPRRSESSGSGISWDFSGFDTGGFSRGAFRSGGGAKGGGFKTGGGF
ncbi:MAG: hypothetical protein LBF50_04170 [Azoarcus sp.]|jgi:chromosome segregation ATPase|nr:hypothetical protein [Azoarcus sp.]